MMLGAAVAAFGLAALLRLLPLWIAGQETGADHWFWRITRTEVRGSRRYPPQLPQYLLDRAQWYPPVFPLLLSALPESLFEFSRRRLSTIIDLMRLALLFAALRRFGCGFEAALAAGTLYAATPVLVSYDIQLNPRGLGALWLDAFMLILIAAPESSHPAALLLLSGLILLTHKMTTQLFWFLLLGAGCLVPRAAWFIPLSMIAAFVMSGGFYARVARAHADIVAFWSRNWRWMMADAIRESPIYGSPAYETPGKAHRAGIAGIADHLRRLARYHPGAWLILAFAWLHPAATPYAEPIRWWLTGVLAFAAMTQIIPPFKCLGMGDLYIYNSPLPAALCCALGMQGAPGGIAWRSVTGASLVLGLAAIAAFLRLHAHRSRGEQDGLPRLLALLKGLPKGSVFCTHAPWYDMIAHHTGQPVLFGGHGYGFRELEPYYPVLRRTFTEMKTTHALKYILARAEHARLLLDILAKERIDVERHVEAPACHLLVL